MCRLQSAVRLVRLTSGTLQWFNFRGSDTSSKESVMLPHRWSHDAL